jgi:hypothetical protein
MTASPLAAQNIISDDRSLEPISASSLSSAPAPVRIKPEKILDKKFVATMGSLAGSEGFRFTTRRLVVEREYAASAPWITHISPDQNIVGKDLALFGAEFFVAYELKKSHSWLRGDRVIKKLWWAYPIAMSPIHVKNAVANVRTQAPTGQGGCTTISCAQQMQ